jgi:hypothetical protein
MCPVLACGVSMVACMQIRSEEAFWARCTKSLGKIQCLLSQMLKSPKLLVPLGPKYLYFDLYNVQCYPDQPNSAGDCPEQAT